MNEPTANAKTTEQASSLSSMLSDVANTKLSLIGAASSLTQLRLAATPVVKAASTARATGATTTATTATSAADTTRYQALAQTLTQTKAAIKNTPQVSSETFVIQGLFVDETGQPRADCSLVATDAGDVLSSKLHPQRANADGYATLVLRAQEFPTVVGGTVPIFVSVIDGTGSQVYAPTASITAKAGTVAVFRATIPGTPSLSC